LLLYRRQGEGKSIAVALNLGSEPISIASRSVDLIGEILLSTLLDRRGETIDGALDLRSNEGVIIAPSNT
jgi:alpha-glucosidase